MSSATSLRQQKHRESNFFTAMAVAMAAVVFVGFAPTFFLRPWFPEARELAAPEPIFYVHGVVFTAWMAFLIIQTSLVRGGRIARHRSLGIAGMLIAAGVVILGTLGALVAAGRPGGFIGVPLPPLTFLTVPIFDMLLFGIFVGLAYRWRSDPGSHKRLMILATINLLEAAVIRAAPVQWIELLGPIVSFGVSDLFIVAIAVWDLRSMRRLHPVTLWAGLAVIVSQPVRFGIGATAAWQAFAGWSVALIG